MIKLIWLRYRLHLTRYAISSCRQMAYDAQASIDHYEQVERELVSAIAMERAERRWRVAR